MIHVTAQGARLPALGFGTYQLEGPTAREMVALALQIGYRHFDTAQTYGNEREVGAAIVESGVPRDQIWLTTKIWPSSFRDGALQRAAADSAERLHTPPDLLLLHWPAIRAGAALRRGLTPRRLIKAAIRMLLARRLSLNVPLKETIRALNDARRRGLTRQIGLSNFPSALIREAVALSEAPLIVNQVEYHPYLGQAAVLAELRRHGMALVAYAPIAHGRVFQDATLQRIGARHGKSPGQVALRWLVQQEGVCAIPKSGREAHARANFAIFDFALSDAEMAEIAGLARPDGRLVDPAGLAPVWD